MAATHGAAPDDGGIQALFDESPEVDVHTSAIAELGFLLGLLALAAAPFAVMHVLAMGTAALSVLCALVGIITTSRRNIAGRALVPLGLALALTALVLIGLRYLGLDTAFGDRLLPTFSGWLKDLNARFPGPG
ncbi:MAG: hypothetical protein J2P23_11605 [Microlunatus sp.]|nr:hypothetical protein [Microlunatus sp.]